MTEASSSALEHETEPVQPGRQLALARERCGFTIADVARQLKLSPAQVEAMEADDNQRLPGAVFARGFVRNYARLVKLDPALLLADTKRQSPPVKVTQSDLAPTPDIPFPTGREFKWPKYAIAALLVLAVLAAYEFYRDDVAQVAVTPQAVVASSTQTLATENVTDVNVAEQAAGLSEVATTAEHKQGEHLLRLRFDRESWVEIRDRHGRRIASQLNPAGTELEVSGLPPFSLVVGNAAGVRLTHNDQPVDLAPHIKIDVARLTLE